MKKVLVISSTLRKSGNSEILAKEFEKGAISAGNSVEAVSLIGKEIAFCTGCLTCQQTGNCIFEDDASKIAQKMLNFDVIVFATPIYFFEMSGQMKTLLDRTNPLFPLEYKFRDIYLIATAAEFDQSAMDGAIKGLQGWVDCFEKAKLNNVLYGVGLVDANDVLAQSKLLTSAFEMGAKV